MEHADQTQSGSIPPSDNGPIEYVHEGMDVVDASGDKIGTVSMVKMGDPQSPTIGAGPDTHQSIAQGSPQVFDWNAEPDVPPQLAAHLLRVGFIKVDTKGLFAKDRYVPADLIAGVSGNTVGLNVNKDDMAEES